MILLTKITKVIKKNINLLDYVYKFLPQILAGEVGQVTVVDAEIKFMRVLAECHDFTLRERVELVEEDASDYATLPVRKSLSLI
jgi:hypothetical protein